MVAVVGEYKVNARHLSHNVMARDRVLYDGHALGVARAYRPRAAALINQINVNIVNPGWTQTVNTDWSKIGPVFHMDAANAKKYAEALAIQNRIIQLEEMGGVVVMLASEAGNAITGQVLDV